MVTLALILTFKSFFSASGSASLYFLDPNGWAPLPPGWDWLVGILMVYFGFTRWDLLMWQLHKLPKGADPNQSTRQVIFEIYQNGRLIPTSHLTGWDYFSMFFSLFHSFYKHYLSDNGATISCRVPAARNRGDIKTPPTPHQHTVKTSPKQQYITIMTPRHRQNIVKA